MFAALAAEPFYSIARRPRGGARVGPTKASGAPPLWLAPSRSFARISRLYTLERSLSESLLRAKQFPSSEDNSFTSNIKLAPSWPGPRLSLLFLAAAAAADRARAPSNCWPPLRSRARRTLAAPEGERSGAARPDGSRTNRGKGRRPTCMEIDWFGQLPPELGPSGGRAPLGAHLARGARASVRTFVCLCSCVFVCVWPEF